MQASVSKEYIFSIKEYKYIFKNYNLSNYEIYEKMYEENKDNTWAYNICFIEKYLEN